MCTCMIKGALITNNRLGEFGALSLAVRITGKYNVPLLPRRVSIEVLRLRGEEVPREACLRMHIINEMLQSSSWI